MQIIPIDDVFSQTFSITLASQSCTINLYQTTNCGLFCDLYVNNVLIIGGVICENVNKIVRSLYLGFTGDLCFLDTQGTNDPSSPGLGTRYLFCYLQTSDLNGLG